MNIQRQRQLAGINEAIIGRPNKDNDKDLVKFSQMLETWRAQNPALKGWSVQIDPDDGEAATGLVSFYNKKLIRSINGGDAYCFKIMAVFDEPGSISVTLMDDDFNDILDKEFSTKKEALDVIKKLMPKVLKEVDRLLKEDE